MTALCPGATDTDFFTKGDLVDTTIFQKGNVSAPQEVAKGGYEALMRGDRVYVAGGLNKLMVFLRRLMPESAQAKVMETLYSKTEPTHRQRGDVEKTTRRETRPGAARPGPGPTGERFPFQAPAHAAGLEEDRQWPMRQGFIFPPRKDR